jgi:hypothetical protein
MPRTKYLVKTIEQVEGTYIVEAEDDNGVLEAIGDGTRNIKWEVVEQQDYQAFSREVVGVSKFGDN